MNTLAAGNRVIGSAPQCAVSLLSPAEPPHISPDDPAPSILKRHSGRLKLGTNGLQAIQDGISLPEARRRATWEEVVTDLSIGSPTFLIVKTNLILAAIRAAMASLEAEP